jgi:hypothetical protein
LLFDIPDQRVEEMTIDFIWVDIERRWFSIEERSKFCSQLFLQIIKTAFIEDRTDDAAAVKGCWDANFSRQEVVEALANCGLNLWCFKVFLLLTCHPQGTCSNSFNGFVGVTIDPKNEVWNHGGGVHFGDLIHAKFSNNPLVDEGRVYVSIGNYNVALLEQWTNPRVGVIKAICSKEAGFLQRGFITELHRSKSQLTKFTVSPWFMCGVDFWKREFRPPIQEAGVLLLPCLNRRPLRR